VEKVAMAAKAKADDTLFLNISGIPGEIEEDEDYLEHYFGNKKCGGGKVELINYDKAEKTAIVNIKGLDSEGTASR